MTFYLLVSSWSPYYWELGVVLPLPSPPLAPMVTLAGSNLTTFMTFFRSSRPSFAISPTTAIIGRINLQRFHRILSKYQIANVEEHSWLMNGVACQSIHLQRCNIFHHPRLPRKQLKLILRIERYNMSSIKANRHCSNLCNSCRAILTCSVTNNLPNNSILFTTFLDLILAEC